MTSLASSGFPTTTGAYDTSHNGSGDAYVLKLAPYEDCICSVTDHYTVTDNGDNTCTVVFQPNATYGKDASILNSANAGKNFGASDSHLPAFIDYGPNIGRGVFYFDVSVIPAGAVIDEAYFELYCYDTHSGVRAISAYYLEKEWNEGTGDGDDANNGEVTWNSDKHN